jgi:hypothetical protein
VVSTFHNGHRPILCVQTTSKQTTEEQDPIVDLRTTEINGDSLQRSQSGPRHDSPTQGPKILRDYDIPQTLPPSIVILYEFIRSNSWCAILCQPFFLNAHSYLPQSVL